MKRKLPLVFFLLLNYSLFCQETYVPDDNFENYLETHNTVGGTVLVGDPTSIGNGIANNKYNNLESFF